jgi:hypothetical protein
MSEAKRRAAKKYRANNKDKVRQANKNWKEKNPAQHKKLVRRHRLKKRYGLTEQQFDELLKNCDGKCKGCRRMFSDKLKPHVDHDHKTGRVRGLLCFSCNTILGLAKDDPYILQRLISFMGGEVAV